MTARKGGARPARMVVGDPKVLATLYDPARYRVFRALATPRSVPEVAERLGVSANRLYYHVRRLLEVGLIVQVGTRPAGKHTERLFAHAAEVLTVRGDVRMEEAAAGVGAVLQDAFEELGGALRAHEAGEFADDSPGLLSWHIAPMTLEEARAFEKRFEALVAEFNRAPSRDASRSKRASRFAMLGVFTPLPEREG